MSRDRHIDKACRRDPDKVAVESFGQLHRGLAARGAQEALVEKDEQAAVRHGEFLCR